MRCGIFLWQSLTTTGLSIVAPIISQNFTANYVLIFCALDYNSRLSIFTEQLLLTVEATMSQLNPRQQEAMQYVSGPLLVLAGAGSE